MCGLYGYIGDKEAKEANALDICIKGLERLEYRGYDSSGIAGILDGKIKACKRVGNIAALKEELAKKQWALTSAIGHTRWATHGKPTSINAHPHMDEKSSLALVHNGIIENHHEIREQLLVKGATFKSETDTEVLAQLISHLYCGDIVKTMGKALKQIKGSLALALVHVDYPGHIITCARDNPLVIGMDPKTRSLYLSSDLHAFDKKELGVIYLKNSEIALISPGRVQIFDKAGQPTSSSMQTMGLSSHEAEKADFEHFMLKEIHEQPFTLKRALEGRLNHKTASAQFEGFSPDMVETLKTLNKVIIVGCGSSYHAALIAKQQLTEMVHVACDVEIASEFRYSHPVIDKNTLIIALSQSGETADTLAAVKKAKGMGLPILGITNHPLSSLGRESEAIIELKAGQEVSVCSTKVFTSQLAVLSLFSLMLSGLRNTQTKQERLAFITSLEKLEAQVMQILMDTDKIKSLAHKYSQFKDFFFLGRQSMFPSALEGALKLKEITYLSATGYPSGEMKHGPIALVCPELLTLGLLGHTPTNEKMLSSLMEVKARDGAIVVITSQVGTAIKAITEDIYVVPKTHDLLAPILYALPCQLFAYFMAKQLGLPIDKPRNLAKSVTVE